jgi:hypothetical protein
VVELTFISILAFMVVMVGLFSIVVVARVVEPRGVKALLRRLAGK